MTGSSPKAPRKSGTSRVQAARVKGRKLMREPTFVPAPPVKKPLPPNVAAIPTRKKKV